MRRIESPDIAGPAGRIEGLLETPDGTPRAAALVCHPHPLHGGTLHNKVAHRLARALRANGAAVLRFNFRGVNRSAGAYDHGRGELDDALAALGWLQGRYPGLPLTLAGFSFGSRIALLAATVCAPAPRRVIAAGFPTAYKDQCRLHGNVLARIFVQSTHDEFGPRAELEAVYASLWQPKQLHWVEARDHFFSGALDALERTVAGLG